MDTPEIVARLQSLLPDRGLTEVPADNIKPESSLREDLGLDSLKMVEFIVALEEEFEITFDDSSLNRDDFTTVEVVAGLVHKVAQSNAG